MITEIIKEVHNGIEPIVIPDLKYTYNIADKYNNICCDAFTLLETLFHASFQFDYQYKTSEKGFNKIFHFTPSEYIREKTIVTPYKAFEYTDETIKNHINYFLNKYAQHNGIDNGNYKISLKEAFIFSLFFMFHDGRELDVDEDKAYDNKRNPINKFTLKGSCSTRAYKQVLEVMLETSIFKEDTFLNSYKDDQIFIAYQLHKIDEIFKFFKVIRMDNSKNRLLSEDTVHFIEDKIMIPYDEKTMTKKTLKQTVLKDPEFIQECLKADCPDPLLVFYEELKMNLFNMVVPEKYACEFPEGDKFVDDIPLSDISVLNLSLVQFLNACKKTTLDKIKFHKDNADKRFEEYSEKEKLITSISPETNKAWFEYYFESRKELLEYISEQPEGERKKSKYIDFLFDMARRTLLPSYFEKETGHIE